MMPRVLLGWRRGKVPSARGWRGRGGGSLSGIDRDIRITKLRGKGLTGCFLEEGVAAAVRDAQGKHTVL